MAAIDEKIRAEAFVTPTTKSFDEVRRLGLIAAEQSAGAITKVVEDAVVGTDIVYLVKRAGLAKVMVFEVHFEPGSGGDRSLVLLVPGWYWTSQAQFLFIPVGPKDAAGYPSLRKFAATLRALLEQDGAAPATDSNTTAQAAQPQALTPTAAQVASSMDAWYTMGAATAQDHADAANSATSGTRLQELARFPELWPTILQNTAIYPDLREWIEAQTRQQPPEPLSPSAAQVASTLAASGVVLREHGQVDVGERPTVQSGAKGRISMIFGLLSPISMLVSSAGSLGLGWLGWLAVFVGWVLGFGGGIAAISVGAVALRTERNSPKAIPVIGIAGGAIGLTIAVLAAVVGLAMALLFRPIL